MPCHGVSVPPQSKITARTATRQILRTHPDRAVRPRNNPCGTLAIRAKRAPGSVKLRAGGESPRPVRCQRPVDPVKFRDRRLKSGWEAARKRSAQAGRATRVRMCPRQPPEPNERASRRQARMFTGIVAELGEVAGIEQRKDAARLTIRGSTEGVSPGESIAVNGVCLTVTGILDGTFTADVMGETLNRSSLGALTAGSPVNLEQSVRLSDRLGGHLVQGHVDATGTIMSRSPAEHWDQVRISLPAAIARYVVHKGSITVDGISLTVSALGPPGADTWFEVCLIPETLKRTTMGTRQPGETVNLEVDVIAKYVERLLNQEADK